MKFYLTAAIPCVVMLSASAAWGHGHPIIVTQSDNRLSISGGVPSTADGFADQIYVEIDSTGDPQDYADFANFGPGVYWNVPGFNIFGLAESSGLYLQPLARPVRNSAPVTPRVLWYWNPISPNDDKVEPAPSSSRLQIRQDAVVNTLLLPNATFAPPAMKLAAPLASDMGFHNHDLARYVLPYPLPNDGAYAFFARLTSDVYAPSDPFLVLINNGGLEGAQMLAAAAAINRDALLAGDYNHDDRVDAADYIAWRNTVNSTTQLAADGWNNQVVDAADYDLWRANFGRMFGSPASGVATGSSVPEPSTIVGALVFIVFQFSKRHGRGNTLETW